MVKKYEVQVPEYITSSMLKRIKEMMERGEIHPRHHLCDMTLERAAGAPPEKAVEEMVRRNDRNETYSIYRRLFPQRKVA